MPAHSRRRAAGAVALALSTLIVPQAAPASPGRSDLPDSYVVSNQPGVLPEGIEVTGSGRIYVTSSGTGDVYVGHVGRPTMTTFAAGASAGRSSALGLHEDALGRVFVASPSAIDVYAPDGRLLAHRQLPTDGAVGAYLNDLVITNEALYVTDSAQAIVWRASLRGLQIGNLEPWLRANELRPDFQPGWFYLNGIVASPDGRRLLVSAQGLGALIRVDVSTREKAFVTTDGSTFGNFGPDGMLLDVSGSGDVVRGVLNYGAPNEEQGLYVARLSADWSTAAVVAANTESSFSTPTTVAASAGRYLVVNSQLDTAPGTPPWTVVAVADPLG